jgi:hypothetical protein
MASATGILEAYRLPLDEQTLAARATAAGYGVRAPDARPLTVPDYTL